MLNRIIVQGRCARDPEMRTTPNGIPVTTVTLAVDRDYGKEEKETDWIDVVAWRETAKFLANYFSKGRMAVVSGRLQIRGWTDKDGNKRRTAEIVADNVYFADSKRESDSGSVGGYNQTVQDFVPIDSPDDGLPF